MPIIVRQHPAHLQHANVLPPPPRLGKPRQPAQSAESFRFPPPIFFPSNAFQHHERQTNSAKTLFSMDTSRTTAAKNIASNRNDLHRCSHKRLPAPEIKKLIKNTKLPSRPMPRLYFFAKSTSISHHGTPTPSHRVTAVCIVLHHLPRR